MSYSDLQIHQELFPSINNVWAQKIFNTSKIRSSHKRDTVQSHVFDRYVGEEIRLRENPPPQSLKKQIASLNKIIAVNDQNPFIKHNALDFVEKYKKGLSGGGGGGGSGSVSPT